MTPLDVVLDTNVALDWLLFDDPHGRALGAALTQGELRWIATGAMRDEFFHVLGRGALDRWNPDPPALHAHWDRHCAELPPPAPGSTGTALRCTDPDDQKFIDLAAAHPGRLLLSRDRAVLKLARKLERLNIQVTTPAHWIAGRAAQEPTC